GRAPQSLGRGMPWESPSVAISTRSLMLLGDARHGAADLGHRQRQEFPHRFTARLAQGPQADDLLAGHQDVAAGPGILPASAPPLETRQPSLPGRRGKRRTIASEAALLQREAQQGEPVD